MMSYDDPNLSDREFLRAVRNDPKLDVAIRLKAATTLLEIEQHDRVYAQPHVNRVKYRRIVEPPSLTIRIELPQMLAEFAAFPPELQRDLVLIKHCYDQGLEFPDLDCVQVKGHA